MVSFAELIAKTVNAYSMSPHLHCHPVTSTGLPSVRYRILEDIGYCIVRLVTLGLNSQEAYHVFKRKASSQVEVIATAHRRQPTRIRSTSIRLCCIMCTSLEFIIESWAEARKRKLNVNIAGHIELMPRIIIHTCKHPRLLSATMATVSTNSYTATMRS